MEEGVSDQVAACSDGCKGSKTQDSHDEQGCAEDSLEYSQNLASLDVIAYVPGSFSYLHGPGLDPLADGIHGSFLTPHGIPLADRLCSRHTEPHDHIDKRESKVESQ